LNQSAALIEAQASGYTPIIGSTIAADRRKLDQPAKKHELPVTSHTQRHSYI
jgi:hypothetical protein